MTRKVATCALELRPCATRCTFAAYLPGARSNGGALYLGDVVQSHDGRWYSPGCRSLVHGYPTPEAAAEGLLECRRFERAALVRRAAEAALRIGGVDVEAQVERAHTIVHR